jgi:hypothetical protein
MTQSDLKNLIKDNTVQFSRYRKGYLYYTIASHEKDTTDGVSFKPRQVWEFPVPIEDVGDATFNAGERAILFMRYIRKAQEEGSFALVC